MTNNSRIYECLTKLCSNVTTGRLFQTVLRGRGYTPPWGKWGILLGNRILIYLRKMDLSHIFHCFILYSGYVVDFMVNHI